MYALKEHLINFLVQKGLLSLTQVEEIANLQKEKKGTFSYLLEEKKIINKETLVDAINRNFELLTINAAQLKEINLEPQVIKILPADKARQYHIFPLSREEKKLKLILADPLTIFDLDFIEEIKEYNITPLIAPGAQLNELIGRFYPEAPNSEQPGNLEEILSSVVDIAAFSAEDIKVDELVLISQEGPIIKATDFILHKAIESKASDVLIEPLEGSTRIRFRLDGILHQMESLPKSFHTFIVSRIKVLANLDIAEHRFPQDGQFKMKLKDREVEFRVSVFPATTGEKVALRILDKSLGMLDIDKLSLGPEKLQKLKQTALMPNGIILVCGPTGSGKTSTLYSILKFVHNPEINIVTVEDPVEYQIKGINQVLVNTKTGLTFGRCLRAILRQDPDVIMIGEIRDFETVDIAIKAALTGHLVLSTLHTTTASGSVVRLVDMGVEPFLINASLIGIIAQRLARRICLNCKEPIPSQPYFKGRGCKECLQTGYSGRVLVSEILYATAEIKEAILSPKLDENRIKEIARAQGMRTLREEGEALALEGITTLEEVYRVTPS